MMADVSSSDPAQHADRSAAEARAWLADALAAGRPAAAVLVALTRFDLVNAAYGRAAGDALLHAARRRLNEQGAAAGVDFVLHRVGGAVFLLGTDARGDALRDLAERLSDALAHPFATDGTPALLGHRVGAAAALPGDDAAALVARASEALATAAGGGAAIRIAGEDADTPIESLAVDLHRAIARDEIEVLFQPQVDLATDRIVGVEALARWEHPALGVVGAEPLFAAADRAGLAQALSDHLQTLVLARAARWPGSLGAMRLAVNLTAADVARPGFAAMFLARVAASGFPADRLTVEVTEGGLIEDLAGAAALLQELRNGGIRVAIDDFGTGYSSLAYLKALPLDYLKLDKRLAQDIAGSPRDRVIVAGVIAIARGLGMAVIAEGVETTGQRDQLAAEGVAVYQGYLCAGALSEDALAMMVEERCSSP